MKKNFLFKLLQLYSKTYTNKKSPTHVGLISNGASNGT